ncbi:MAG: tRNA (adenosine(37)-N6)-threonylcarbamoyltransferase complex dimerization subunit type 1 TsaB [Methylacidiphilales bacterium]|nr:tRNA (adenosine(37)-N6)-threonylcarbamoyltransferase complex dimerization subunit type 1 TsaB [Candidatus Methylacidiphilales bacterium]
MKVFFALDQSTAMRASVGYALENTQGQIISAERVIENANPIKPLLEVAKSLYQELIEAGHTIAMVVATSGPGGFTGLRVCASVSSAISQVANCPFVGIGTLEALAFAHAGGGVIYTCVDARRSECYCAQFNKQGRTLTQIAETTLISNHELEQRLLLHPGVVVGNPVISDTSPVHACRDKSVEYPQAKFIAECALVKFSHTPREELTPFSIEYVRSAVS